MRKIIFYKDYFSDFYSAQSLKVKEKIKYCLSLLEERKNVPTKFVKYIINSEGIYEIRVRVGNNQYRILFFFEEGNLIDGGKVVIVVNGFVKKNDTDLKKAVKKAEKLRLEYLNSR